jgi:hypothetical protein
MLHIIKQLFLQIILHPEQSFNKPLKQNTFQKGSASSLL